MKKIYLDYASTTPVKKEVLKAMMPYFFKKYGNPSSIHVFGRESRSAIEETRKKIANFLNCKNDEIIFTSGGTESDNLAIKGLIDNFYFKQNKKLHIITSSFEHHAVLETCKNLEKKGMAQVTYIKPNREGIICLNDIKKAVKKNTILISIMYVNNEIGTVQPIKKIAQWVERFNKLNRKNNNTSPIYFHTDAVQALEYQECDIKKIGVDMMSFSAHKIGGPKGLGALFVKKNTPIKSEIIGGKQEFNLRAGTENAAGIIGLGTAIELLHSKFKSRKSKIIKLRDYFIKRILKEIPDTFLNGSKEKRNPNNINISFKYIEGESILINLDLFGIAASSGSACTSGSLDPSHVLLSIGLSHEDAHGSIRFTIGENTTKKEIDYTMKKLKLIVKKLRDISPFTK